MLSWNEDPIVFRDEAFPLKSEKLIEHSSLDDDSSLEYSGTDYILITDNEVVDVHSNIMLPSWLRAYNSGENTYIEYIETWENLLTPIPDLDENQMINIRSGFTSLFVGFWLVLLFSSFIFFLFRLLSGRWLK